MGDLGVRSGQFHTCTSHPFGEGRGAGSVLVGTVGAAVHAEGGQ